MTVAKSSYFYMNPLSSLDGLLEINFSEELLNEALGSLNHKTRHKTCFSFTLKYLVILPQFQPCHTKMAWKS